MNWTGRFKTYLAGILKRLSLPGFGGYPLYEVGKFFVRGIQKGAIQVRASSVAYNLFLAIFPASIFLFTLIPYVPIDDFQVELLAILERFMPNNAFLAVEGTIMDIIHNQRGSLLSITFLIAIFVSSNGMLSLIRAFNSSYHTIEFRSWLNRRMVAILLVFIMSLLVTIAIALITINDSLYTRYFAGMDMLKFVSVAIKWLIILALLFFANSFIFYLGPARKSRFRFITPGATLATILQIIASLGFSFFVNHFGRFNKLYGSIGTIMVVLISIYILAFATLIGFELNASIMERDRLED